MKRLLILLLAVVFLVAACAPKVQVTEKQAFSDKTQSISGTTETEQSSNTATATSSSSEVQDTTTKEVSAIDNEVNNLEPTGLDENISDFDFEI